jgi:transposase, IS30 family
MNYHHFNLEERKKLFEFKNQRLSNNAIGKRLGKHPANISRELKRNKLNISNDDYYPLSAHQMAKERRSVAQKTLKEWPNHILDEVKQRLEFTEDPNQIHQRMKLEGKKAPSHETIYKMIYENRYGMGVYVSKLRRKQKKRKDRRLRSKRRSLIPNRQGIELRPATIGMGHWEGDTVIGKNHKGAIATFVERHTKFFVAALLNDKTAQSLNQVTRESFASIEYLKTFTFDNGLEFAGHEDLSKNLGVKCYFANPYSSWERGLNEHTNRLLRQFFPKKTNFQELTNSQVQLAVGVINNRPRKCLNYLTPNEVYFNHSNCHLDIVSSNLHLYSPVALHF